jgi:hypothetical protein
MFRWFYIVKHGAIEICDVTYLLNLFKINLNQYLGM